MKYDGGDQRLMGAGVNLEQTHVYSGPNNRPETQRDHTQVSALETSCQTCVLRAASWGPAPAPVVTRSHVIPRSAPRDGRRTVSYMYAP